MKKIQVGLMALVAAALAAATVFERLNPDTHIYSQWWFVALMAVVAAAAIASIVHLRMWQTPGRMLIYASVAVILFGGGLTTWVGQHGSMKLLPGIPSSEFKAENEKVKSLPFSITLDKFEVVPYSGTRSPMDFVSHVTVEGESHNISMNNILRHRGYRFYQEDYGDDGSSTLSVAHDPWGIAVTYCGYAMLIIGLLWLLLEKNGHYRKLIRNAAIALLFVMPVAASATPNTLPRHTADRMGRMYVLYKGRVCPLQTLAKDFTTKLTGNATYHGLSPEQFLSGYLFYYTDWADEPVIKIKRGQWMQPYNLEGRWASFEELMFLDTVTITPSTDKHLRATAEKHSLVRMLLSGKLLKLYPIVDSTGAVNWYGQNDDLPLSTDNDEYIFVRRSLSYFQELVAKGDFAALENAFDKTRIYQESRYTPSPSRTKAERLYNTLTTGRWLAILCITVGLIVFAYSLIVQGKHNPNAKPRRWVSIAASVWVAALSAFILLIFILRWIAGGHAPMAGGFDSMNLMALVIGIVALLARRRFPEAPFAGILTMGFCLLVAMMSGSNPPVTNLMPVLNSPLLTLHVTVIMCSYALFFFVMMGGVAGLITKRDEYRRLNLLLLYPAVTLLALGIIIGALWANISWGNYWSWDPKEVWALITLIVYAIPIMSQVAGSGQQVAGSGQQAAGGSQLPFKNSSIQTPKYSTNSRAFYIYCIVAFLSVVITYFGVNLILGGVHSYA